MDKRPSREMRDQSGDPATATPLFRWVGLCLILAPWAIAMAGPGEARNPPCVVDAFLRAHQQTMQATADSGSVDTVIALVDENVIYEHPRVGIRIESADAYRQGLEAFLGATDEGRYEVQDYLVSGNTVAVSMLRVFSVEKAGSWEKQRVRQLTVFEIGDGKILRITDFW